VTVATASPCPHVAIGSAVTTTSGVALGAVLDTELRARDCYLIVRRPDGTLWHINAASVHVEDSTRSSAPSEVPATARIEAPIVLPAAPTLGGLPAAQPMREVVPSLPPPPPLVIAPSVPKAVEPRGCGSGFGGTDSTVPPSRHEGPASAALPPVARPVAPPVQPKQASGLNIPTSVPKSIAPSDTVRATEVTQHRAGVAMTGWIASKDSPREWAHWLMYALAVLTAVLFLMVLLSAYRSGPKGARP
jgi:hypothetical protein